MALFDVEKVDLEFYSEVIRDFVPDTLVDDHSHIYLKEFCVRPGVKQRSATWPGKIAADCSMEDMHETYRLLFPGKKVIPVLFGQPENTYDIAKCNDYVEENGKKYGYPMLYLTHPSMTAEELERGIQNGGFWGSKVYLNYAPAYIPGDEIRIFDFLPHHQLDVLNRHGWVVMLHIARPGRLKDKVNLAQMLEIQEKYPNIKLIIAHVGRAYAQEDVGDAFRILKNTGMYFDLSANVNADVFTELVETIGPKRLMFGLDLPVIRMRGARVVENGVYYNLIPKGLYGDVSDDYHMREVEGEAAARLTFMAYEEIAAFKTAAYRNSLTKTDVEDVFFRNAFRLFGI